MPEELSLVTELAIILIAAATFTIISKALKQPPILGYIIAGFIVGPNLGLFPQFSPEAIHEWSEIGIIFLLFGLGLEFSFKKLIKIGSSAFITAGVKCIGMFVVGYIAGHLLGWTSMESIFLGGLLGMSSTTIIIKAYDDMGLKNKPYSTLIFGSLVFEDLIAVLLLVLLSTIAVTGRFSGPEMISALVKLIFFLILWFLIGIYLIPIILRKARTFLNDEIVLLVSVGLCFTMVVLANVAGFSSALGAFVMGSILAETMEGTRIERVTSSLKDLFGAIFFVSVGMMVDPTVIAEHWLTILAITIITISGILVFSCIGALMAGKGLDTAVHAGFSLAQLGEFAFIIAGLGCSLGVMREFIYPVIIAVSVITTFTTPYMIKLGEPASRFIRKVLPAPLLRKIDPPQDPISVQSKAEQSEWVRLLKDVALRYVLYGVILVAILLGASAYLPKLSAMILPDLDEGMLHFINCIATIIIMLPFLYGLSSSSKTIRRSGVHLLKRNSLNRWPLLALLLLSPAIILLFTIFAIDIYYEVTWWIILLVLAAVAIFVLMSRKSISRFDSLEKTFLGNLNEREENERLESPVTTGLSKALAGYDVHLEPVVISPDFELAGKTLREMPFRRHSDVNILKIKRGNKSIVIPSGNERIMPGDRLLAVGTEKQLERFRAIMEEYSAPLPVTNEEEFCVESLTLGNDSPLTGRTLKDLDMRRSACMVVSVLRNRKQTTNPEADFRFEAGDIVWLAGEKSAVEWYK